MKKQKISKFIKPFSIIFVTFSYLNADNLPLVPVTKTGITTSEVDGDDGYYQAGKSRSYTRDDSLEVVVDNTTGLMWQDNDIVADENSRKNWQEAIDYCDNLSFAGYSDWRLPKRMELKSIVDYGRYEPAIDPIFRNISFSYYWSSSPAVSYDDGAWHVDFNDGAGNWNARNDDKYVRCARKK